MPAITRSSAGSGRPPSVPSESRMTSRAGSEGGRLVPGRVDNDSPQNVVAVSGMASLGGASTVEAQVPTTTGIPESLLGPVLTWDNPEDRELIGGLHPRSWAGQTRFYPLSPRGLELATSSVINQTSTLRGYCLAGEFVVQVVREPAGHDRLWGYHVESMGYYLTLPDTRRLQERLVADHAAAWIADGHSCKDLFMPLGGPADPALARLFGIAVQHHVATHPISYANDVECFCERHGIDRQLHASLPELEPLWHSLARGEGLDRLREGRACPQIATELGLQVPAFEAALQDVAMEGPLSAAVRGGVPLMPLCDTHGIAFGSRVYRDLEALRAACQGTAMGRVRLNEFDMYNELAWAEMASEFWSVAVSADTLEDLSQRLENFRPATGTLPDGLANLFKEYRELLVRDYPALCALRAGATCRQVAADFVLLPESREMDALRLYAIHRALQECESGSPGAQQALQDAAKIHQLPQQSAAWQVLSIHVPAEAFDAVRKRRLRPSEAEAHYGIPAYGVASAKLRGLWRQALEDHGELDPGEANQASP